MSAALTLIHLIFLNAVLSIKVHAVTSSSSFLSRPLDVTTESRILLSLLRVVEAPVSRALPASADLGQSDHEAGQRQDGPSHQDHAGQDEGQQVDGRQEVRVGRREEGEVPAEEESVQDGER